MVRAAFARGISFCEFLRAWLERGVLFSGVAIQLSSLHGHGLSRLSYARRVREIPDLYGARGSAARAGRSRHALLVRAASLDFHALYLLEPVALHRAKFRIADDVLPARGRLAHGGGTPSASPFVYRFLHFVDAELPHRGIWRCAYLFSGARS